MDFLRVVGGGIEPSSPRNPPEDDASTARIAAMALHSHYTSRSVPERKGPIGLRFIGLGKFGRAMVTILREEAPQRFSLLEPCRRSGRGVPLVEALRDPQTEAVYICSPDAEHTSHAKAALLAGRHVLVEKPVARYADVRMQAMSNGLVLMVGFQRRFAQKFREAKQAVLKKGAQLRELRLYSADPVPASQNQSLESIVTNSVIHDIDTLVWMLPPRTAYHVLHVEAQPNCGVHIDILAMPPEEATPSIKVSTQRTSRAAW